MTIPQAVILGIVEGITEFLPISSTGHMILVSRLMGIADQDFTKSFEIFIQAGAILAVVVLYWRKFLPTRNPSTGSTSSLQAGSGQAWRKVLFAFVPTAVLGFLFYKLLKTYLLGNSMVVVWALAIGGVALIVFELWHKKRLAAGLQDSGITLKKSFAIGVAQALAIIPGVSRSGATIVGGVL